VVNGAQVDEQLRAEDVEVFYDPGELLAGLIKGAKLAEDGEAAALAGRLKEAATVSASTADAPQQACPFLGSAKQE
jgi:hypothetical protein